MSTITRRDFTLLQGDDWERLVIVKDRRTHRVRHCSFAHASMRKVGSTAIYPIDTSISREGGITLFLDALKTYDLTGGTWEFDVVSDPYGHSETIVQGVIEVSIPDRITSLGGVEPMLINYTTSTDFRRAITWTDYAGATLDIKNARMQAVDSEGAIVLDLGYYALPPVDSAVGSLDPEKRGYITPLTGASFEIHISNLAVIEPGTYSFDILAQEAESDDWGKVASGSLVVTGTVTDLSA